MGLSVAGLPRRVDIGREELPLGSVFTSSAFGGTLAIAITAYRALHLVKLADMSVFCKITPISDDPNDIYWVDDEVQIRPGEGTQPLDLRPSFDNSPAVKGTLYVTGDKVEVLAEEGDRYVIVDLSNWTVGFGKTGFVDYKTLHQWSVWRVRGELEWPLAAFNSNAPEPRVMFV